MAGSRNNLYIKFTAKTSEIEQEMPCTSDVRDRPKCGELGRWVVYLCVCVVFLDALLVRFLICSGGAKPTFSLYDTYEGDILGCN